MGVQTQASHLLQLPPRPPAFCKLHQAKCQCSWFTHAFALLLLFFVFLLCRVVSCWLCVPMDVPHSAISLHVAVFCFVWSTPMWLSLRACRFMHAPVPVPPWLTPKACCPPLHFWVATRISSTGTTTTHCPTHCHCLSLPFRWLYLTARAWRGHPPSMQVGRVCGTHV